MKLRKILDKFIGSPWVVTLFATTIGVLLAFYLNNLNEKGKVQKRKNYSFENVKKELNFNINVLTDSLSNDSLVSFLDEITKIDSKIPNKITVNPKTIYSLKKRYPRYLIIIDSTNLNNGKRDYNVAYRMEIQLNEVQNIAWETSKMSGITNEFSYDCLQSLVATYTLQDLYSEKQKEVLEYLVRSKNVELLASLRIIVQLESQLVQSIELTQEQLKTCK